MKLSKILNPRRLESVYLKLSSFYPRPIVARFRTLMIQGGFTEVYPSQYLGFTLFLSLALFFVVIIAAPKFFADPPYLPIILAFGAFIAIQIVSYYILLVHAESKAQKIEEIMPDALQVISSNVRAGMTLENAIWTSSRPEFGPLRDEIKQVSAETFVGKTIDQAFAGMSVRVRSEVFGRAVRLIVEGIRLGGSMANLLDEVARDLRTTQRLQKEIVTATMMYAIFIVFAGVIIAPVLFAVSSFYAEMNEKLSAKIEGQKSGGEMTAGGGGAGPSKSIPGLAISGTKGAGGITANDLKLFSIAAITITTFCAALVLGIIQSGKASSGFKYGPIFVFIALMIFFGARAGLNGILGGLFGP